MSGRLKALELSAALAMMAWRAFARPAAGLWQDYGFLTMLFWAFAASTSPSARTLQRWSVGFASYLLAVYAWNAVPGILAAIGAGP